MDENKKPKVPGMIYIDYNGLTDIDLSEYTAEDLSELLEENNGKLPVDEGGNVVMCYAIDAKTRWKGNDEKPVMCYAMSPPKPGGGFNPWRK